MTQSTSSTDAKLESKQVDGQPARNQSRRELIWNTAWLFGDRAFTILVGLFVNIFVVRYLGKDMFGLLSYALSVSVMVRVFASLGLNEIVLRDLVKHEAMRDDILGTSFCLRLFGGVIAIVLSLVIVLVANPEDELAQTLVIIVSLTHLVDAGCILQQWNTSQVRAKFNVVAANVAFTLASASKLLLVLFAESVEFFAWTSVAASVTNVAILFWIFGRNVGPVSRMRFDPKLAKTMMRDSSPRIPAMLAGAFQNHLGVVFIGAFLTEAVLGEYSLAMRFFLMFAMLPSLVCQSVSPRIMRAHANGRKEFANVMTRVYSLAILCFAVCSVVLVALSLFGIPLLYGGEFQNSGRLLMWLAAPLFVQFMSQVRSWYIIANNMFVYSMWLSAAIFVVSVVTNYFFIRALGVHGAIMSVACSAACVYLVDLFYPPARDNLRFMRAAFGTKQLSAVVHGRAG